MTSDQVRELIERLRSAGVDGDSIYLWNQCTSAADALSSLLAENERLREELWNEQEDAKRYRWLRDNRKTNRWAEWVVTTVASESWDAAIDDAIASMH